MKLRGMHAQRVETMDDALAKLASGHMTHDDLIRLQSLVSKGSTTEQAITAAQKSMAALPTASTPQS